MNAPPRLRLGLITATRFDMDAYDYNRLELLGIGTLAAYIQATLPGVEVILREHIEDLIQAGPDIIGIGSITENYGIAISWAEQVKRSLGIPVIVGGTHITLLPSSLKSCFDIAVIGEGELTTVELLSSIISHQGLVHAELKKIPGLCFHHDGETHFTGERGPVQDLDTLPHLRREALPFWRPRKDAHVVASRGCPYRCNFCSSTRLFPSYRTHSADYIVADIERLVREGGINHISILDDLLVANRRKFADIVDRIAAKGLNKDCAFVVLLRANIVDDALCDLLKKLNVSGTVMGVESFSDSILRYYCKTGVTAEINQAAIDTLHRHRIPVSCCFIFGAPIETRTDLVVTLQGICRNLEQDKIERVYWGLLKPYPGTDMWEWAVSSGLVDHSIDWERFMQTNYDRGRFFGENDELYLAQLIPKQEFLGILEDWFARFSALKKDWGVGYREAPPTGPASAAGYPPGHFYSPIVDVQDAHAIRAVRGRVTSPLPQGIALDTDRMVALTHRLAAHHSLFPFPRHHDHHHRFFFDNSFFGCHDASVYFSMLLEFRPHRVIEVGCGHSTALLLDTNKQFFNDSIATTFIDPSLAELLPPLERNDKPAPKLLPLRLQDVPVEIFTELETDDILFIDSSHVSKTGSDVNHYLFEILPRLKPGVLIHIHDILYPFEYLDSWVLDEGRSWNEAYALKAFLQFNSSFEIVYWSNFVYHRLPELLRTLMPLCLENEGGSIWLRKRPAEVPEAGLSD